MKCPGGFWNPRTVPAPVGIEKIKGPWLIMIYSTSDPGRFQGKWGAAAGKGQTNTLHRESVGIESLFGVYLEETEE